MAAGPFQTRHDVTPGKVVWLEDDIRSVAAANAGPMTFTGTQSYLLGRGSLALIDPGPKDAAHRDAILAALESGERIEAVLVTHSHLDHAPLAGSFGVPVHGFGAHDAARAPVMAGLGQIGGGEGIDHSFAPDVLVEDGAVIEGDGWSATAIHTPGHLSNHLCFASGDRIFSGDHVMGWASTLISPPDGDLGAYMASLARLRERPDRVFYPGHGAPVADPGALIDWLAEHRRGRERQVLAVLGDGPADVAGLVAVMYREVDPRLHGAAGRNVLAHLIDLFERGLVAADQGFGTGAIYRLA